MTEIEILDHNHEAMESTDVASIISTASSEFDPVREIAFQLGVDFIEYSDFEDIQPISTEAKAIVKRAIWKEQSREVALKQILGDDAEEIHEKLETEIMRALQNLDHDNLMQLYGVTQDVESNSCMIVLQLAKSGNLREFMTANPESPWIDRLRIARDVTHGLRQLHKAGVIHGDLHAKNVFIDDGKAFIRAPRMIAYDDESTPNYNESPEIIPYVDPRLIADMNSRPDRISDIYSLGILLWEISSKRPPFGDYENQVRLTVDILAKKRREQPVPNTPEDYVKLYKDCWQHDSASRPTIDEVCDKMDEFLKDDPLSAHLRKKILTEESDEEEFTFEEEPLPQPPPIKTGNGHAHLSNGNHEVKQQNGSVLSESNTDIMINKQTKRSSKLFKTFKLDIQKTKSRLVHAWSRMSCSGRGHVYDDRDGEKDEI